jgi:hypothetical protein
MITQTSTSMPVIDSLYLHQFDNRYSIYCHDPSNGHLPVSIEKIEQLATELKAQGAVIVKVTSPYESTSYTYLTADSFETLQSHINRRLKVSQFRQVEKTSDGTIHTIHINSPLFSKGYPKLFISENSWIDLEQQYGEIGFKAVD